MNKKSNVAIDEAELYDEEESGDDFEAETEFDLEGFFGCDENYTLSEALDDYNFD